MFCDFLVIFRTFPHDQLFSSTQTLMFWKIFQTPMIFSQKCMERALERGVDYQNRSSELGDILSQSSSQIVQFWGNMVVLTHTRNSGENVKYKLGGIENMLFEKIPNLLWSSTVHISNVRKWIWMILNVLEGPTSKLLKYSKIIKNAWLTIFLW